METRFMLAVDVDRRYKHCRYWCNCLPAVIPFYRSTVSGNRFLKRFTKLRMVLQQGLSSTRDEQHPNLHPILYECCPPGYRSTCGTRGLEWLCDVKNDPLFSHGDVEGVRRFWQGCPDSRFTSIASVTFSNLGTSRDAAYFDAKGQTSHPKCLCILGGTKLQPSFMQ